MKRVAVFFLIFALIWSAVIFSFDVMIFRSFAGQIRSQSFAQTEAVILSSRLTEEKGEDSTTYGASVSYEFFVAGKRYESNCVRFGQFSDSSGTWARAAVEANRPGTKHPVYYNPALPAESVLQRGVGGRDWFEALFATPFNLIMIGLWFLCFKLFRPTPKAGGAIIQNDSARIYVQLSKISPLFIAAAAFGAVSFLGILVIALSSGFSPKVEYVWTVWLLSGFAAMAAFGKSKKSDALTHPDLVIDSLSGTLTLSRGLVQKITNWREWKKMKDPSVTFAQKSVREVEAVRRTKTDSEGDAISYVVVLKVESNDGSKIEHYDLGAWMSQEQAESFASWLRDTLRMPGASAASAHVLKT